MTTNLFFLIILVLMLVNTGILFLLLLPKTKIDRELSKIIRRFEREKDCLLRIEMIESENVYLRNPQR